MSSWREAYSEFFDQVTRSWRWIVLEHENDDVAGEEIVISGLTQIEKDSLEALRSALLCENWRDFAAKADYLKGLVEKDQGAIEIGSIAGEGIVLVVRADLGSIARALKNKIAMRRLGLPVLGFTMPRTEKEQEWLPISDLLGLEELKGGG